ncbi:hypothetical protein [Thermoleptolyngbya sp.]
MDSVKLVAWRSPSYRFSTLDLRFRIARQAPAGFQQSQLPLP